MSATGSRDPSAQCDVSVVVPTYNGHLGLEELCRRVAATLDARQVAWELILVDDASPDQTPEVAASLQRVHPRLRYVRLPGNAGQHAATVVGMRLARGAIVVTMDDDLQQEPESIPLLLDALHGGAEVAVARFSRPAHPLWRYLSSRIVARFLRAGDAHSLQITSFKAFRHGALRLILDNVPEGPFYLASLMLAFVPHAAIVNVDVPHRPRKHGRSNYGPVRLLRLAWRAVLGSARGGRYCR